VVRRASHRARRQAAAQAQIAKFLRMSEEDQIRFCTRDGPLSGYCECCQDRYTDIHKVRGPRSTPDAAVGIG